MNIFNFFWSRFSKIIIHLTVSNQIHNLSKTKITIHGNNKFKVLHTHRTKLGPQRRLDIYVGFQSSSIINYIEPLTSEVFTARFAYCHFNEDVFLPLGGEK